MKKNKKVALSKKPFLVLSRRAIAGWLGVIFILCAWMFIIGILVGRGTAPLKIDVDDLQSKLEISRQNLTQKQPGQARSDAQIANDKTKLDFYEALPEDREDAKIDDKKSSMFISKQAETPPPQPTPPATGEKADPSTKPGKLTDQKAGTSKKQEAKQPVAAKSETKPTGNVYTIQVAAVKVAKDADRLVAELKKKGFSAYRVMGKVPDQGIWFRVRVGKYNSRAASNTTLNKLKKLGHKPILVSVEQ